VNLIVIAKTLGTEEQCLDYLEGVRWPGGVACLSCGSTRVVRSVSTVKARRDTKKNKKGDVIKTRRVYDCLEPQCGHQFSATTGTLFHDSHIPLTTWILAIAIFVEAKKSISALQLKRMLGLGSYKTAWHLCHRIRKAMEGSSSGIFSGTIEVDEMYIGGRYDKRRKRAKFDKQIVVGLVQRGTETEQSKVKMVPVDHARAITLAPLLAKEIEDGAALFTDESSIYRKMHERYQHDTVNHGRYEYVRGDVHTNGIEGVWSLFNRGIVGSFHQITIKHMRRYLAEAEYKFNGRGGDLFRETLTHMVNTRQLTMAELVSDPEK
jgi:transposase-like protein